MKFTKIIGWSSALFLSSLSLPAQPASEVEQLKAQLRDTTEKFEQAHRAQQQQIDALTRKLEELSQLKPATAPQPQSTPVAKSEGDKRLEQELAAELAGNAAAKTTTVQAQPVLRQSMSQPVAVARAGSAYMNISFDAQMDFGWSSAQDPAGVLQLGDHDPSKRGFSLRNAEIALDGAIDPYFKGFANIVLKLDNDNATEIELEETYLQSTSLPANLQLRLGQFFSAFGRHNPQHPHQWAFVDQPIVLNRAFGPDGLRSITAQLSWLAPTPFYTELILGVLDGQGGTAFSFRNAGEPDGAGVNRFAGRATFDRTARGLQDLVYVPRVVSSFELSDTQTLLAGLSAAFGPNETGLHSRTQVYGADVYWKWKPANAKGGFPFATWQTEILIRHFEAGADSSAMRPLPGELLKDRGFYSQVLWGFRPRWVAGLRAEYASGNSATFDASDVFRGERHRVSPVLTFYPSEFSKFRAQYNYDHGKLFGDEHSLWFQMEFLLGAHGAHKF